MISLFMKYRIPVNSILGESMPLITEDVNNRTSSQFDNLLH